MQSNSTPISPTLLGSLAPVERRGSYRVGRRSRVADTLGANFVASRGVTALVAGFLSPGANAQSRLPSYSRVAMIGSMLLYDLGLETLAKTLLYLGADTIAAQDIYGNNVMQGATAIEDPWVSRTIANALKAAAAKRPTVGTVIVTIAPSLLPPRLSRVVVAVLPEGYLIAHIGDIRNSLTDAVAFSLASEIKKWMIERQNPYLPRRPRWLPPLPSYQPDMSRFRTDLSRF